MSINFKKLKSGSDIRGTAIETPGNEVMLTNDVIAAITKGFYTWLDKKLNVDRPLTICVGRDSRLSGERIMECVKKTLINSGANVIIAGLSSTPAMFMTTRSKTTKADAAIEITASHHPFDKNGLKFFTRDGGLDGSDILDILNFAENNDFTAKKFQGKVSEYDFMGEYSNMLVSFVRQKTGMQLPLENSKIVVDAGNGVGGFYAEKVLLPLGAIIEGSQFLEPDGSFPNHIPNPENKDAMESISKGVLNAKADLGIIFDTDVDRAALVGADGKEINRNSLIALISWILLNERKGATIVTDSVTSDGLAEFIKANGGIHHRFKRGYKNVINECIRLNKEGIFSPLAIETSGHAALMENFFLDDGAYLVTRILISYALMRKEGKSLLDAISSLKMPAQETEIRLTFETSDFSAYGEMIIADLKSIAKMHEFDNKITISETNYEGVRLNFSKENGDGFVLVRMSVHDPIMPINAESMSSGGVKTMLTTLNELLSKYTMLNRSNLINMLK